MSHYYTNNTDLRSKAIKIEYTYYGHHLAFYSDYGVFAKNRVDFGTNLLLQSFRPGGDEKKRVLDVGCGYGIIGLALAKAFPNFCVELVDVNGRAVDLARKNAESLRLRNAAVYLSDIYEKVSGRYDIIITNPPVRAGKKVVHGIFEGASDFLTAGGVVWTVIRKAQGAESLIKKTREIFEKVIIVKKIGGYHVLCCGKNPENY